MTLGQLSLLMAGPGPAEPADEYGTLDDLRDLQDAVIRAGFDG